MLYTVTFGRSNCQIVLNHTTVAVPAHCLLWLYLCTHLDFRGAICVCILLVNVNEHIAQAQGQSTFSMYSGCRDTRRGMSSLPISWVAEMCSVCPIAL